MTQETAQDYCPNSPKYKLKNILGKIAAVISLAASIIFYPLGFQVGRGFYEQWQHNKEVATKTWDGEYRGNEHTKDLPWGTAVAAFGTSLAAGFTGLAIAKSKRRQAEEEGYITPSSSYYASRDDDNFFMGYMLGSSNGSSSSSSSSGNNGGAAAAIVIVAVAAAAASAGVVSYKSMKANFGSVAP